MPAPAATAQVQSERILTPNFFKLFMGAHCYMNDMSLYYLLPHFLELRGATPQVYGLAAGTSGMATVVSLLLFGRHSDRWSRKRTVLTYLLLGLVGDFVALSAVNSSIGWYFLARILHGIAQGLGFPLVFGWAVELCPPRQRYVALSWLGISGIVSNTLGPFLSELILNASGNPRDPGAFASVFAMGIGFTVVAIAIFATVEDRRVVGAGKAAGMTEVLRRRDAVLVLAVALLFGGMFGSLMSFGKNYTESRGLTFVSLLMVMYTFGAIVSRIFIREIAERIPQSRLTDIGLVGIAVSFGLLGFADGYWLQGLCGVIYGFSHGVLYPTLYVRFIDIGGPSRIGRSATVFQGAFSVGIGALPVVGGFLISGIGFPSFFWMLAVLALGGLWLSRRSDGARRPPEEHGRESG
jgi:MFS family permease